MYVKVLNQLVQVNNNANQYVHQIYIKTNNMYLTKTILHN